MAFGVLRQRWSAIRSVPRRGLRAAIGGVVLLGLTAAGAASAGLLPNGLPLAAPAALAASPSTVLSVVSVRGGFDPGRVSVTVDVTNGGGPFAGWLEVSGTERRVLLAVDVPTGASRLAAAAYPVDNRGTVRVRLLGPAEEPVSGRVSATIDYAAHALVVGDRRGAVAELLSQGGWLAVDQATAPPAEQGRLDLYSYLVVAGPDPASSGSNVVPPGSPWSEVRSWVSRGGVLVVAGPSALPGAVTQDVLQADFLPARALEAASELTVAGSDGTMGSPPLPAGTLVTPIETAGASYSVTLGDGTVVVAGARLGLGAVLFVGVGPSPAGKPADSDDPVRFLWENLVLSVPRGEAYMGSPWTDPPHLFVTGRVPSLAATGAASLLYTALLGLGSFVLLRRLGRRDAVWWVVPVVVVTTTLVVLGAGVAARGARQEVLTRRTVTLDAGASGPAESLIVGVYAPFGARFGVGSPSGFVPGGVEGYDSGFVRPYTIRDATSRGGGVTLEDVRVAPGSGRSVGLRAAAAAAPGGGATLPGAADAPLSWSRSGEGGSVRWTVTNVSGDVLRRLIVVANGVYTLPDLPPGGTVAFTVGPDSVVGQALTPVKEEPARPASRDYLEWEAESRLRAEWAQSGQWIDYGATGTVVAPPPGTSEGKGFAMSGSMPAEIPVRVVAFAEDRGHLPALTGLSGGASLRSVVVYEAVLR